MADLDAVLARIAEQRIVEAMAKGEFDNLPGKGQPLRLDDFSLVPEHLRLGFVLLKSAGFLPHELELSREMAALEKRIDACTREDEKAKLRKEYRDKKLLFDILVEQLRRRRFGRERST